MFLGYSYIKTEREEFLIESIDCEDLYSAPRHYDMQQKEFIEDIPFYMRPEEIMGIQFSNWHVEPGELPLD